MPEETQVQNVESTPQEPVVPLSEGVTMGNDSADDAFLDHIMVGSEPNESDDPSLHSHVSPSEDGLTEEEASTGDVVDATEVDSQSDDDNSGKPAEPDSDDYAKAIAALQRDGVPRSVIDQMADENPQSVIDWGLKRAKVQSDVDGYGSKVKELEEKLASNNETPSGEGEGAEQDQSATKHSDASE